MSSITSHKLAFVLFFNTFSLFQANWQIVNSHRNWFFCLESFFVSIWTCLWEWLTNARLSVCSKSLNLTSQQILNGSLSYLYQSTYISVLYIATALFFFKKLDIKIVRTFNFNSSVSLEWSLTNWDIKH